MVLHSDASGKVRNLEARPLFKEAQKAYLAGDFEQAVEKFTLITRHFGDTSYGPHAQFNLGLSLNRLKRWSLAVQAFVRAHKTMKKPKDRTDAMYNVVEAYEALKQWPQAEAALRWVLAQGLLPPVDRVVAKARLGQAYFEQGKLADAEEALNGALDGYREHIDIPILHRNVHVAHAQYQIGAIYKRLFNSIRFRLPVESMKRDLIDKSHFFLKAQSAFLRTIRQGHAYWAVAGGFQLGSLYEDFYDHMMTAEVPKELSEDDRKIYFEELRGYIRPLVIRAIDVYERNMGMSDRLREKGEWSQKTKDRLDRMRTILRTEFRDAETAP